MPENPKFVQLLATSILVFGCLCVAAADHFNWRDLAGAGTTVLGVGAGILTGQRLSSVTNKDGGTINVNPDEAK